MNFAAGNKRRRFPVFVIIGAKIVLAAGLLCFVLSKINVSEAAQRLTQAAPSQLAAGAVAALVIPCVLGLRWWLLARPVVSWNDALVFTWIGYFYSLILPGAVSGDIAKGSFLAWKREKTRQAILPASILADRLIGLTVMIFFFCLSSLLVMQTAISPELNRFAKDALAVGVGALSCLLLGWTRACQRVALAILGFLPGKTVRSIFQRFADATFAYAKQPHLLFRAAVLSAVAQSLSVLMYVALLRSLKIELGLVPAFALYSVISVLGLAPITFAGIGLRDWFAVAFFAAYRLPPEAGVAFAWLCLAMGVLQAIVGGAWQAAFFFSRTPRVSVNR